MRAVVFDCDGVLVDSEIIAIEVEVAALAEVGVPLTPEGLAERYVGMSASAQADAVAREFGVDLDRAWWDAVEQRSHDALAQRAQPVPGIRAVIEGLAVPYCLASSSSHPRIELTLGAAGLLDLFGRARRYSAQDVEHGKPAPDLFLHAAADQGWDAPSCTVVEDSPYGVQAAIAAGMDVIGFTGGGHTDAAWAQRLRDAGAAVVVGSSTELASALVTCTAGQG